MAEPKSKLSRVQIAMLKEIINKKIEKVSYFYWGVINDLHYSLDWIELSFNDKSKICFTFGDIAENIEIIDFNLDNKNSKIKTKFDGEVIITQEEMTQNGDWNLIKGKEIKKIEVCDFNGYCDGSVKIYFENKYIEIFAGCDDVNVKFIKL